MSRAFSMSVLLVVAAMSAVQPAGAETFGQIMDEFAESARSTPGFQGFSAANGEQFFKATHGNDWSCASCHTENPASSGKHAKTSKLIKPMAPLVNPERFTDPAKVEKWFKRNCNDVLERACTAQEKGDVLTYLLTINK
ncbi:MAG: DUF1924 domain-containing protein [Gammaproteobacteria bacterium]|nr:DUF1924 domain-containing protein [Gammaproteobacteria bacterium]MBU1776682.1 DUF1924 domain-containing protein [Gammaproteobacteria bacterium]MBU1968266.1 DUF1924 domain-containing protein [Gammaproteobacteria bacterium]